MLLRAGALPAVAPVGRCCRPRGRGAMRARPAAAPSRQASASRPHVATAASSRDSDPTKAEVQPPGGDSGRGGTSKEDILARIAAARQYKDAQRGGAAGDSADSTPPSPASPPAPQVPTADAAQALAPEAPAPASASGMDEEAPAAEGKGEEEDVLSKFFQIDEESRARQQSSLLDALQEASDASAARRPEEMSAEERLYRERTRKADVKAQQAPNQDALYRQARQAAAAEEEKGKAAQEDSGQQPARFLRDTLAKQAARASGETRGIQEGQRMEDYLLAKEQKQRSQEVEFISVDKNYKPKVATWGMFPRPDNISKAYGGGRTIKPGETMESDDDRKEREGRVKDRIRDYKISQGLLIDEATEMRCQELYDRGMALMKAGQLAAAADIFGEMQGLVVLNSSWGGRSRLQRALCLDSLARTDEAKELYQQIRNHPEGAVAKQAKQMMFGITSMDYLKTHTISYRVRSDDYAQYFERIRSDWDSVYLGSEEEDAAALAWQSALALAVMLSPVVAVGAYVVTK
mmetsp:Transcript_193/g.494  ORF Transcript_193/g.494 Transcript_193/m.494 type:complete len:521 (+) Transcript_193:215-1777(+)